MHLCLLFMIGCSTEQAVSASTSRDTQILPAVKTERIEARVLESTVSVSPREAVQLQFFSKIQPEWQRCLYVLASLFRGRASDAGRGVRLQLWPSRCERASVCCGSTTGSSRGQPLDFKNSLKKGLPVKHSLKRSKPVFCLLRRSLSGQMQRLE